MLIFRCSWKSRSRTWNKFLWSDVSLKAESRLTDYRCKNFVFVLQYLSAQKVLSKCNMYIASPAPRKFLFTVSGLILDCLYNSIIYMFLCLKTHHTKAGRRSSKRKQNNERILNTSQNTTQAYIQKKTE